MLNVTKARQLFVTFITIRQNVLEIIVDYENMND